MPSRPKTSKRRKQSSPENKSVRFSNSDLSKEDLQVQPEPEPEPVFSPPPLSPPQEQLFVQEPEDPAVQPAAEEAERASGSVQFRSWLGHSTPVYCQLSDSSVIAIPAKHGARFIPRSGGANSQRPATATAKASPIVPDQLQAELDTDKRVTVRTQLFSPRKQRCRAQDVPASRGAQRTEAKRCVSAPCHRTKASVTMSRSVLPAQPSVGLAGQYSWSRLDEKQALQDIHEQFAAYVAKVRQLSVSAGDDPLAARVTVQMLEQELNSLRNAYETELERCRHEALLSGMEKTKQQSEAERYRQLSTEYEARLGAESQKTTRLLEDVGILNARVAALERDLTDARTALSTPLQKVEECRQQMDSANRENSDLKDRINVLTAKDNGLSLEVQHLTNKLAFQQDLAAKRESELQARLETAATSLLQLERRVLDLSKQDDSVPELIRSIQEKSDYDLKMALEQSETRHLAVVGELKDHLGSESDRVRELSSAKSLLEQQQELLSSQLSAAHHRVAALEQERSQLLGCLQAERDRAASRVHEAEARLQQSQDLVIKMEKFGSQDVPLRSEIESLRHLVKDEEKRLLEQNGNFPPISLSGDQGLTSQPVIPSYASAAQASVPRAPSPVGPILSPDQISRSHRASSAPGARPASSGKPTLVPTQLGAGRDYFDAMFNDLKTEDCQPSVQPAQDLEGESKDGQAEPTDDVTPDSRPQSSVTHDYANCSNTHIGDIKINEVHSEGKYIRLINLSTTTDVELGGFMIQQNVGSRPVAVFRFPLRTKLQRAGFVTVWCGRTDPLQHQPPTDFVNTEQLKWGTGPECTTILCKPNGQAVAWATAAHRFTPDTFRNSSPASANSAPLAASPTPPEPEVNNGACIVSGQEQEQLRNGGKQLTDSKALLNTRPPDGVYLRRPNPPSTSLLPQRHPHGEQPGGLGHPRTAPGRQRNGGNEGSSWHPQSRSQQLRPDPISSNPYAVGAQRHCLGTGKFSRSGGANRATSERKVGPPTPFLSPKQQDFFLALEQNSTVLGRPSVH